MIKRVTRRGAVWLGLLPLAAATAFVLAATSNAAPKEHSHPLHGHMRNIVQHIPCADSPAVPVGVCSTFEADGSFHGDGYVIIDTFPDQTPGNFGFSKAHTVIHTKKGDLRCHEAALFDTTENPDHPFVDLCLIQGDSTGDYAGAKGYIQEVGTFPGPLGAPGTVGSLEYYGQITLQHD